MRGKRRLGRWTDAPNKFSECSPVGTITSLTANCMHQPNLTSSSKPWKRKASRKAGDRTGGRGGVCNDNTQSNGIRQRGATAIVYSSVGSVRALPLRGGISAFPPDFVTPDSQRSKLFPIIAECQERVLKALNFGAGHCLPELAGWELWPPELKGGNFARMEQSIVSAPSGELENWRKGSSYGHTRPLIPRITHNGHFIESLLHSSL